jgi:hypothetical protein
MGKHLRQIGLDFVKRKSMAAAAMLCYQHTNSPQVSLHDTGVFVLINPGDVRRKVSWLVPHCFISGLL